MREISAQRITDTVKRLCIEANCHLGEDVQTCINRCYAKETWPQAKEILERIIENYEIADQENMPICQDTGVACEFLKIGQDVHITGDLTDAVNEGVRQGYNEGYLRKSVVRDPLDRVNTGDNTPAMLYVELVAGDQIEITVAPKGFGSETMSRIAMLSPSDGLQGVKDFVLKTVDEAGPNPCPPIVVGVGIGGTFDKAALLAKKSASAPCGREEQRAILRETRGGITCGDQHARHRPTGLRRFDDGAGSEYRNVPDAHRRASGRGKHQLPCDKT